MKFYLAGQQNFGNRGCEALVRSVSGIVGERLPGATFLVPTFDQARDGAQWPGMAAAGCEFVPAPESSLRIRCWNRAITRIPALLPLWEPRYAPAPRLMAEVSQCDGVLMIGGDVISLDYGPGSLFKWSGLMDAAQRAGRPTMLFAASVGPFDGSPLIERYMVNHLRRYSAISVRETFSLAYLHRLGLHNAVLVADPAFRLKPEPVALGAPFDQAGNGVLAFNISPLVAASWQRQNPGKSLIGECAAFLRRVLSETPLSIALLPHVDPLDGASVNSDSHFMASLLAEIGGKSDRVAMVRRGLNAAQLKFVIGACRYLIAARTHATVAGWSQHVPTISIAYSVKARGLNQDLFDTLDYVLDTPKVGRDSLWASFKLLADREASLQAHLAERIPRWYANAGKSAELLAQVLR
ncbi:polysaccharide pyruvyl transferase family protein [Polaromonas hydrogenivorans]|uniref:Polysaccharide pyruvyl transferase family protein n=1 Tax=Polaromonas hydrogenivorans TaxID=335476 RepID=A0AAU7LU09_9BURK